MSDAFHRAVALTLEFEGGYSDDARDPGGRTDMGISSRAHPEAWSDGVIDRAEASNVYREWYWDRMRCEEMPAPVAVALFDFGVSSGVAWAATHLQRLLGVKADGIVGPVTIDAIRRECAKRTPQWVAVDLCVARSRYLIGLGKDAFVRGWIRRVVLLTAHVARMEG